MEKYSRFRDSGTGIQVFLTPVPPAASASPLTAVFTVPAYILGAVRILLLAIIVPFWIALSSLVGSANRSVDGTLHAVFGQLSLLILGFSLIKTERVSLKNRGRAAGFSSQPPPFNPQKGDIILSNFSSWLDIVYAAVNFNPIFLLPVVAPSTKKPSPSASSAKPSPARRRNAGASVVTDANERGAAAAAAGTSDQNEKRLLGFEKVSLWKAIANAGNAPLVYGQDATGYQDLAQLTKNAQGPLMVFPELTTSNNRGLLRMAPIFPPSWRDLYKVTGALRMGKGQPELFVMSIKHDPPTTLTTSTTHSVPSRALNPLPHLWSLCASFSFAKGFQVRQLDPAESPTSGSYAADSAAGSSKSEDALAEAAGNLISGLARLKRTGLGWEDKEVFLDLVTGGGATKRGA